MKDKITIRLFWSKYGTAGILLILLVFMSVLSPKYFLSVRNLTQVVLQSSITILMACGEFFAILIAGIDLSIGSILGLSGMIMGKLMVSGINMWEAIAIGCLIGIVLGMVNGFFINKTGLHPFIVTLGTQSIYRGITLVISQSRPAYGFDPDFKNIIGGYLGFIPVPVIISVLYAVLLALFIRYSIAGRNLYALGGNAESAWFAGINTNKHRLLVFALSGLSASIAGVIMNARVGSAEPTAGIGYETQAIASVIIGGASFFGGKGKMLGVVMGGLIIGVINNGLNLLKVPSYYQQIVMGALIIGAVTLDKAISYKAK